MKARTLVAATLIAGGISGLVSARAPSASSTAVREAGEAYLARLKEDSLYHRMKFGLPIERLPDISFAQVERDATFAKGWLGRLERVDLAELDHDEALSLDVLRRHLGLLADGPRLCWFYFPVTPYNSPIGTVNRAFATFAITDAAAGDRYLALLAKHPAFVAAIHARLEGQVSRGIRIPQPELDVVVPFLRSLISSAPGSPYAVAAARLAGLSPEAAQAFQQRLTVMIDRDVNPTLRRLVEWLDGDYRRQAPAAVGFSQYPGGPEFYAGQVRWHTTLDVGPEDVHRIGLARVEAIAARMKEVRYRLGFKGTNAEFKRFLKTDPRFFPRTPDEIGARLMAHVRRIEPKVDAYFLHKPKAPYGVKRLELELEAGQTFGYYQPPTATEPVGMYRFNGSNLSDRSLLNAAALIYHELVPGHHFQINLANENESIPAFRREIFDTAYTEGWGEYASELAEEMGMYSDPYDLYGRLAMDMFISTRLVVDTGMNALGWSRGRALEFMSDHLMETETQLATESLRYSCDIPGQALAYKMGAIRIRELRERARAALGDRFDVRRFHEAVLGSGSLPMTALARHVDWFVEQERKR
jgi:uncharacterized protein (DUF885 family)